MSASVHHEQETFTLLRHGEGKDESPTVAATHALLHANISFLFFFATHKSETQSSAESALCLEIKQLINCIVQSCWSRQFHTRKHTPLQSDSSGYSTKHAVIRKEFWTYHICKIFPSLWKISRKLGNCVSFPSTLIPHHTIPIPKMISGKFLSNFYLLHHETWNFTAYLFYESPHKVLSATVPVMRTNYATVDTREWGRKHLSMTMPLLFVDDERTSLHLFVWARRLHAQFLPDCCVAIDLKSLRIYKTTTLR